jgi:AcrR family transcriptional regulator
MIHDMAEVGGTVRDEQVDRTRERIIRAVADLHLHEHPAAFSVPEVARRAGVSTRTVYRYFPTKEALLDGLVLLGGPTGQQLLSPEREAPPSLEEYWANLPALFAELTKNAEYLRMQATNATLRENRSRRVRLRQRIIAEGVADEVELPAADTERLASLINVLGSSWSMLDLVDEFGYSPEEAAAAVAWAMRALIEKARRTKEVG